MRGILLLLTLGVAALAGCADAPSSPADGFAWRETTGTYANPHHGEAFTLSVGGPEAVAGPFGSPVQAYRLEVKDPRQDRPVVQWLSREGHVVATDWGAISNAYTTWQWPSGPEPAMMHVAWPLSQAEADDVAWQWDGQRWRADAGNGSWSFTRSRIMPDAIEVAGEAWSLTGLTEGAPLGDADPWPTDIPPVQETELFPGADRPFVHDVDGTAVMDALRNDNPEAARLLDEGACLTEFLWQSTPESGSMLWMEALHTFEVTLATETEGQRWDLAYDAADTPTYAAQGAGLVDRWRFEPAERADAGGPCLDVGVRIAGDDLWGAGEAICPELGTVRIWSASEAHGAHWHAGCDARDAPFQYVSFDLRRGAMVAMSRTL